METTALMLIDTNQILFLLTTCLKKRDREQTRIQDTKLLYRSREEKRAITDVRPMKTVPLVPPRDVSN